MSSPSANIRNRGEQFAPRLETKITHEKPSDSNPYLVEEMRIHGYEHTALMEKFDFSDVIYLLFRGELPNEEERELFRTLSIALINPGPRHPATQANITAGVGKTNTAHILPIALTVYGGEFDACANVEAAMRFLNKARRKPAQDVYDTFKNTQDEIPGFGTLYGDTDPYASKLLQSIDIEEKFSFLCWVKTLNNQLKQNNTGILKAGLCAAILVELGFQPRQGKALMQLFAAPGLLAHGLEYANKPLTSMLFEPDDCYEIDADNEGSSAKVKNTPANKTTTEVTP